MAGPVSGSHKPRPEGAVMVTDERSAAPDRAAVEAEALRALLREWYWLAQSWPRTADLERLRERTHRALARVGPGWAGEDD